MANIRSAEKQRRQAEKRKIANRAAKSRLKSALKSAKATIAAGEGTTEVLSTTASVIDKAAKTGQIHKNKADRHKGEFARAVAAAK